MIQFNLLPSVKLEYIKARRTKRLVMSIAIVAGVFSFAIFGLLFVNVNFLQTGHISNLTKEIEDNTKKLQEIEDIDKVLTVQNQLTELTGLHEKKPAADRALTYISQVTPQKATTSQVSVDFENQTISISGTTDSLVTVNKFADTLKFTKYVVNDSTDQINAFSNVVLANFSVTDDQTTYQIDLKFNPEIFDNTQTIKLSIPNIISTRSQTQKPSENLFQKQPDPTKEEGNQ